ncbi:unnamed protein product [Cuscuta campestris]|uniref:ENTH domain-containing protein n=1 Tax=Cuscuta campestris TaxID=132261 RepID=A0A484LT25_9ASTE|nr:unnamed protein product [Cuscuta campestris]
MRPRADVAYCLHALARRLAKTHNWTVALKTLIVIHRTLREGDPTFREELLNFQQRGRVLQMSNFKDDSSPIAWDCSAWVRTYALFLEERLECFRVLKYDIEAERLPRPAQGQEKGYSRTRELNSEVLLEQLPALQQLLYRLIGCRPPQSFLVTMEEYIREAPRIVSVPRDTTENPERLMLAYKQEDEPSPSEEHKELADELPTGPPLAEGVAVLITETPASVPLPRGNETDDLLGLNTPATDVSAIEESNALALAIVPSGTSPFDLEAAHPKDFDPTGWELTLVTAPSSNLSTAQERQLAGGLDSLTLNSLYDEGAFRASQQPVYGAPAPNPFEVADPFAMSNTTMAAPPSVVPTAGAMPNPFGGPFQPAVYPQGIQPPQNVLMGGQHNPFGDAGFGGFPSTSQAAHQQNANPFGSTSLL